MNLRTSVPFWRHAQGNWTDAACLVDAGFADRRELFDKEIETEINNIKKNRHENK